MLLHFVTPRLFNKSEVLQEAYARLNHKCI